MTKDFKDTISQTGSPTTEPAALMTIAEVCTFVKCGRTFLYGEIAARRLRLFKLGASSRCKRSDVEEWLSNRLIPARSKVV